MMALIDTHQAVKKFTSVGLKENQAEAITSVISSMDTQLATKGDISILKADIEKLEAKIEINMNWIKAIGLVAIGLLIKIAFFNI